MSTRSRSRSEQPAGNAPGARFVQNERHYVVIDERITPHRLGDYEVDRLYFPGGGILCVCIETGELCRLSRYSSQTDEDWWKIENEPSESEEESEVVVLRGYLEALGARRLT